MAYGNGAKFDKTDNLLFFSPRSKDKEKNKVPPHFEISKLNSATPPVIENTNETATEVMGTLVKVKVDEREYQGVKNKHASIYLKDSDRKELYVLNLSFRMDSRSLFNGLINLQTFDNVKVSIYESRKGFTAYSLRQDDVRVDWKYKIEELPEPTAVEFKGKTMKDYSVVDDFYAKELVDLNARLSGKSMATANTNNVVTHVVSDADDDKLPF